MSGTISACPIFAERCPRYAMSEVGGRTPVEREGVSTSVQFMRWVPVNGEHLGSCLRARRSAWAGGTASGMSETVLPRLLFVRMCAKAVKWVNVW